MNTEARFSLNFSESGPHLFAIRVVQHCVAISTTAELLLTTLLSLASRQ